MVTVAALYVDPQGVYANLPGVEVWDEARDARTYAGPWPVVAHPPCRSWCRLAPMLVSVGQLAAIGDDGGCFAAALEAVRAFGGVLEHPASSYAWSAFGLPRPTGLHWTSSRTDVGWSCAVAQSSYGHAATKMTWLYYVGPRPDALASHVAPARARVGHDPKVRRPNLPRMRDADAALTPPAFRDVLLEMARSAAKPPLDERRAERLGSAPVIRRSQVYP